MTEREELARQFLARVDSNATPEAMASAAGAKKTLGETISAKLSAKDRKAVDHVSEKIAQNKRLSPADLITVEAIIIPDKRPAIDIVNDTYAPITHTLWTHLNGVAPKKRITQAIPSVGRIELPNDPDGRPYGGSGFVVGKDLLMTNRHVAELFCSGLGRRKLNFLPGRTAGVDFVRENGNKKAPVVLGVRAVVMVHPYWDMALLKVEGLPEARAPLGLSVVHPDDLFGEDVVVLGYPAKDPGQPSAVQDKVYNSIYQVKRLQPGKIGKSQKIATDYGVVRVGAHDSSTLTGNSGGAEIHLESGHVVGLHFAGQYLVSNYAVPTAELARDPRVVDAGVNFVPAGKPDASIADGWWAGIEQDEKPSADTSSSSPPRQPPRTAATSGGAPSGGPPGVYTVRMSIPLEISVRIADDGEMSVGNGGAGMLASAGAEKVVMPVHDDDYATRRGYNVNFLSSPVQMPELTDPDVAFRWKDDQYVVPYHNFSLAMHAKRRLALFTAANVDHSPSAKKPEPGRKYGRKDLGGLGPKDTEGWFTDPRMPAHAQLPDRFFTKDGGAFDRGHVVRREDVAWGATYDDVRFANGDTFHTTNCTPQTSDFNQSVKGDDNWGDLENYVAGQAKTEKLCVLAGPVLDPDDATFIGVDDDGPVRVKIPTRFWKVIVAAGDDGLQSFAFMLEQDLSDVKVEFVVNDLWRRYMIPVADLEHNLPYLRFPAAVRNADQSNMPGGESVRRNARLQLSSDDYGEGSVGAESFGLTAEAPASWRVAKSLLKLRAQVNAKAPNRKKGNDGTIGDAAHQATSSDHNPWVKDGTTGVVTAMDITHDPANGCDADALAEALRSSRDPRIKYLIWNKRIVSATVSPWVWRPYSKKNPHTEHVHISVNPEKAQYDDEAPWTIF